MMRTFLKIVNFEIRAEYSPLQDAVLHSVVLLTG